MRVPQPAWDAALLGLLAASIRWRQRQPGHEGGVLHGHLPQRHGQHEMGGTCEERAAVPHPCL